ncbi:MAG: RNA-binding cell elongation regulator Jag/EloR [Candidatus Binatia bacterium]
MNAVEAEGTTLEEAIANALKQLQVERDRVEIEVVAQPTRGFLGIGGKKAKVRATLRAPLSLRTTEVPPESPRQREQAILPRKESAPRPSFAVSEEIGEKACITLTEILKHMGIDASLDLQTREEETVIAITKIADEVEGVLIGHRGQTLEAIEYLLNRIITKSDDIDAHIAVDVEGYRDRRWKNLENLALRLGERAKRRRKPVTLSPMSPRDRRVIHLTLEDDPLVTTRSTGRGYFRQVCIVPEDVQRRERNKGSLRSQSADS